MNEWEKWKDILFSIFGDVSPQEDQIMLISHLIEKLRQDPNLMAQIRENPKNIVLLGQELSDKIKKGLIEILQSNQILAKLVLGSNERLETMAELLYELLKNKD